MNLQGMRTGARLSRSIPCTLAHPEPARSAAILDAGWERRVRNHFGPRLRNRRWKDGLVSRAGARQLGVGSWQLAVSTWHLALGTWISHRKVFCRDRGPSTPARKRGAPALRMTREMGSSSSEKRRAKSE